MIRRVFDKLMVDVAILPKHPRHELQDLRHFFLLHFATLKQCGQRGFRLDCSPRTSKANRSRQLEEVPRKTRGQWWHHESGHGHAQSAPLRPPEPRYACMAPNDFPVPYLDITHSVNSPWSRYDRSYASSRHCRPEICRDVARWVVQHQVFCCTPKQANKK